MNETVPAEYSTRVLAGIQNRIKTQRVAIVRRVAVILLLLYFVVLVHAGSYVSENLDFGFFFGTSGYGLFPFPYHLPHGWAALMVITPLDPIEVFIYVVFIGQGIWIAWMSLGIIYIMMPLALWVYTTKGRPNTETTQIQSEGVKKVGVLTGIIALFSVLLSVTTFSAYHNLGNYGLPPLILVLGLSTVIIGFLFFEVKNGNKQDPQNNY